MAKCMVCTIHHSTKSFKGDRVFFIISLLSLVKSIWIILQEFANRITKHFISWKPIPLILQFALNHIMGMYPKTKAIEYLSRLFLIIDFWIWMISHKMVHMIIENFVIIVRSYTEPIIYFRDTLFQNDSILINILWV